MLDCKPQWIRYQGNIATVIQPKAIDFGHFAPEKHPANRKTQFIVSNNIDTDCNRLGINDAGIENFAEFLINQGLFTDYANQNSLKAHVNRKIFLYREDESSFIPPFQCFYKRVGFGIYWDEIKSQKLN